MAEYNHTIYKNDPMLLKSYVNKLCSVTAKDKSVHTGIVYTVDPVTESIVLVKEAGSSPVQFKFIMGYAVEKVDILSDDVEELPELFQHPRAKLPKHAIAARKKAVMNLLQENCVPVKEVNDTLKIDDAVTIESPYAPENCISTNPIILTRIRDIVSKGLPPGFGEGISEIKLE